MKKSLLRLILTPCLLFCGCASSDEFASIALIGGADGPTQVFTVSNVALIPFALAIVIAVFLLIIGIIIFLHNRK